MAFQLEAAQVASFAAFDHTGLVMAVARMREVEAAAGRRFLCERALRELRAEASYLAPGIDEALRVVDG